MREEGYDSPKCPISMYHHYMDFFRAVKFEVSGLLDLHIYLGLFVDLEPVLERYIMGPDYDSTKGNKYPKLIQRSSAGFDPAYRHLAEIPSYHEELL